MADSLDTASGISSLGPNPPEQDLRAYLAAALTAAGYGDVCLKEDRPPPKSIGEQWTGFLGTVVLSVAPALAVGQQLSLSWFLTGLLIVALTAVVLVLGSRWPNAILVFAAMWTAEAIHIWLSGGFAVFVGTYGLVFGLTLALYILVRARKRGLGIDPRALVRSVPFLFPLALLLLIAPLVTTELWRLATAATTGRLIALGAITVIPLALFLLRRLLASLPDVVATTSAQLAEESAAEQRVHLLVERLLGRYEGNWVLNNGRTMLQRGFDKQAAADFSPFLAIKVKRPLRRAVTIRTLVMIVGLSVCIFGYLYLLGIILVPPEIAAEWSRQTVPNTTVELLGVSVNVFGGPYLATATLLSIVAVGAFFALLTVEESYSKAMTEALLHEPVRDYVLLGLPYVRLRERQILGVASTDQVGPFASPASDDAD